MVQLSTVPLLKVSPSLPPKLLPVSTPLPCCISRYSLTILKYCLILYCACRWVSMRIYRLHLKYKYIFTSYHVNVSSTAHIQGSVKNSQNNSYSLVVELKFFKCKIHISYHYKRYLPSLPVNLFFVYQCSKFVSYVF